MLQNANFNVMAVTDTNGHLIERYEYTPYGERTIYTRNWAIEDQNEDGTVDGLEISLLINRVGDTTCPATRADLDGDGDVDIAESPWDGQDGVSDFNWLNSAFGRSLPWSADAQAMRPVLESARGVSLSAGGDRQLLTLGLCDFGHQGLPHDREINHAVENRHRTYWPHIMRFGQIDPSGYPDGMNGFERERSSPISYLDSTGLMSRTASFRRGVSFERKTIYFDGKSTTTEEDTIGYIDVFLRGKYVDQKDGSKRTFTDVHLNSDASTVEHPYWGTWGTYLRKTHSIGQPYAVDAEGKASGKGCDECIDATLVMTYAIANGWNTETSVTAGINLGVVHASADRVLKLSGTLTMFQVTIDLRVCTCHGDGCRAVARGSGRSIWRGLVFKETVYKPTPGNSKIRRTRKYSETIRKWKMWRQ